MNEHGEPVLYAIVTGSPAARDVGKLIGTARAAGWDVCVIASPDGLRFIDAEALERRTGHPVRSRYKDPGTPDVLPPADAMIAAPITCNSLAKWAAGISDTLPLGLLVEAVGMRKPVVAVPLSNRAQIAFPPIQDAMRQLSRWGVTILRDQIDLRHEPGSGDDAIAMFPWDLAWQAVHEHPWYTAPPC